MICVAIAISIKKFIPMMYVPTYKIGSQVIKELEEIEPNEVYTLINPVPSNLNIPQYDEYLWNFLNTNL